MKIALGIEYAGCNYYGWQTQSISPTIQETIELALSDVANDPILITGASGFIGSNLLRFFFLIILKHMH